MDLMQTPVNNRYEDNQGISLLAKDQYFRGIAWTASFEPGEEQELLERLLRADREPGNAWRAQLAQAARDRLVEVYQPLAVKIASRALPRFRGMELLDLIQEANIGLLGAIEIYPRCKEFHHERGFFNLAAARMKQALVGALYDRDPMIRLPHNIHTLLNRKRKAVQDLTCALKREPEGCEVAHALGMKEEQLNQLALYVQRQRPSSIQGMLEEDEDEDRRDFVSLYQEALQMDTARQASLEELFQQALSQALTDRQRQVVELRYGFGEMGGSLRSQKDVGEMVGVLPQTVEGAEKGALRKLRRLIGCDETTGAYTFLGEMEPVAWENYYTTKEVASLVGTNEGYVRQLCKRGVLSAIARQRGKSKWLVEKQSVHEYVARRRAVNVEACQWESAS